MFEPLTRTEIPGGWTEQTIVIGGRSFRLTLPADADAVLTQAAELPDDRLAESDPYWAMLWPAARAMAEFVLRSRWTRGVSALELGCGVGLVGVAALAAGLDVTVTDYSPLAVSVALTNARRNGFVRARGQVLDWREPPALRYPLILASDVLYDASRHAALLECVARLLDRSGVCWIGDPGRHLVEPFLNQAEAHGFAVTLRNESGQEISVPLAGRFQLIELTRA